MSFQIDRNLTGANKLPTGRFFFNISLSSYKVNIAGIFDKQKLSVIFSKLFSNDANNVYNYYCCNLYTA